MCNRTLILRTFPPIILLAFAAIQAPAAGGSHEYRFAWNTPQNVRVEGSAFTVDSRMFPGEVGGVCEPFAIEGGKPYRVSGEVRRITGEGRYKLAVEWFGTDRKHIAYDNSWTGQLVGNEFEQHAADVLSPVEARFACIHAGIEPGNACVFSNVSLLPRPAGLAVDESEPAPVTTRPHADPGGPSGPVVADEDGLPPPVAAKTRVTLGCYYFPVMLDWDRSGWGVRKVEYLTPLLGYYDEALPEVADWHIRWAVEHGISFFVFDWYYNQGMLYLNDALEKGFLRSRHAGTMKFCLDWCNEGQCTEYKPLDFSHASLEGFIRTLCERYFGNPGYLKIDGRPVVLIHQGWRIVNAHESWAGGRTALERMREIARGYGHPGVYFVAVHSNAMVPDYAKGGFDAVTSYGYGFCDVAWGGPDRSAPYSEIVPRYERAMAEARRRTKAQNLGFIPTGWLGWDDAPRSNRQSVRTAGNTPDAVRPMIEMLPRYADESLGIALMEAWNEWGEGGAAEPGRRYGFEYLDVLREVLAPDAGPHVQHVPSAAKIATLQTNATFEQINDDYYRRYLRTLDLRGGLVMEFGGRGDLWLRPQQHLKDTRFEAGAMRATTTGEDPILLSPPILDLHAEDIRAIEVTMSAAAGGKVEIYWSSDEQRSFDAQRGTRVELIADGKMRTYVLPVRGKPGWAGTIRQLRFDPTDAPAEIAIDRLATVPLTR